MDAQDLQDVQTHTFQTKVVEIEQAAHGLMQLAQRATEFLAVAQAENLRLTLENGALRARLAEKSRKLAKLRRSIRAFRGELMREMVYTAELTEQIEGCQVGRCQVSGEELAACDWNEVGE